MTSNSEIQLAEIIPEEMVIPELKAVKKEAAVRELVAALAAGGAITKSKIKKVTDSILEREKLGSTGIGNSIAVPHTKLPGLKEPVGAFGRSKEGIDFASLDGAATHSIFLFLSPSDFPDKHVALMGRFVTLIRKGDFVSFLRQTEGEKALHDFLVEVDGW
ncbi:MAG: PTS sugar transporter subunit IIA [Planctomycetes bacterium]|nr:PTS sugar transporter subunit IIA [Planctomycetota bacterium]